MSKSDKNKDFYIGVKINTLYVLNDIKYVQKCLKYIESLKQKLKIIIEYPVFQEDLVNAFKGYTVVQYCENSMFKERFKGIPIAFINLTLRDDFKEFISVFNDKTITTFLLYFNRIRNLNEDIRTPKISRVIINSKEPIRISNDTNPLEDKKKKEGTLTVGQHADMNNPTQFTLLNLWFGFTLFYFWFINSLFFSSSSWFKNPKKDLKIVVMTPDFKENKRTVFGNLYDMVSRRLYDQTTDTLYTTFSDVTDIDRRGKFVSTSIKELLEYNKKERLVGGVSNVIFGIVRIMILMKFLSVALWFYVHWGIYYTPASLASPFGLFVIWDLYVAFRIVDVRLYVTSNASPSLRQHHSSIKTMLLWIKKLLYCCLLLTFSPLFSIILWFRL